MNPFVSIIVPNYNHARFLSKRIESILNQSYTDFELIILDDCSTDDSREVIGKYADNPKVSHVVLNETNSGSPFAQWKRGIALASGKYVWIAESDDYASPDFLKYTVEALETHPEAVLCVAGSHVVDERDQIKNIQFNKYIVNKQTVFRGESYAKKFLFWKNRVYNASMALFRRSACEHLSQDYIAMRYLGDWMFWLELVEQGDVVEIPEKLNYFRQHSSNTTKQGSSSGKNVKDLVSISIRNYKEIDMPWYLMMIQKKGLYHFIKHAKCDEATRKECFDRVNPYGVNAKNSFGGGIIRLFYYHVLRAKKESDV